MTTSSQPHEKLKLSSVVTFLFHVLIAIIFSFQLCSMSMPEAHAARLLDLSAAKWFILLPWLPLLSYLSVVLLIRKFSHFQFLAQFAAGYAALGLIGMIPMQLVHYQTTSIPFRLLPDCEKVGQPPKEVLAAFEQRFGTKAIPSQRSTAILVRRDRFNPEMRDFLATELSAHDQCSE